MLSFNCEFNPSQSPSPDPKIVAEFAQAHQLVRSFSTSSETVENCFKNLQQAFSSDTKEKYGQAVELFLREAKTELDERIKVVSTARIVGETSKQSGIEQQEIGKTPESPEAQYSLGMRYLKGVEVQCNQVEAARLFKLAADQGHSGGQNGLGWCYARGNGVPQDWNEAIKYFKLAAEQGNAGGQGYLGCCYANGWGVPKDDREAIKYFRLAAEQGNPIAQLNIGFYYAQGNDVVSQDLEEALRYYNLAAKQGNPEAQCQLGLCHAYGHGVPQDWAKAIEYYTSAAKQGNPEAQCQLGLCYTYGNGIPQDWAKAIEYYTSAAKQGNPEAQCQLGLCHAYGHGVPQDWAKAIEYYTSAAKQGNPEAQCQLGLCYVYGNGVPQDWAKAIEYYTSAAKQGNPEAQCQLGLCYVYGNGVPQDWAKAIEYYTSAAKQGNPESQCQLGLCYVYGNGVPQDWAKAIEYYTSAAKQGNPESQCQLGLCYAYGNGVPQDWAKAIEYFTSAAKQGNPEAQCQLGLCYAYGNGVPQNWAKAIEYYISAAKQGNPGAQVNLGACYAHGDGVHQNWNEATTLFRKAANHGLAEAQLNLGLSYEQGKGASQNLEEAVRYYRLAADQGLAEAQYRLGEFYAYGKGVQKNFIEAIRLFKLASDQRLSSAQFLLGAFYADGLGVKQDWVEAVRYFRLAADQGMAEAQQALGKCYTKGNGVSQDWHETVGHYKLAIAKYKHMDPLDRMLLLYKSEKAGFLEQIIADSPLSTLPSELLIRFLGSKPFPETKRWLEQKILTEDGIKTRLETLSGEQKTAILSRFTRYDYAFPLDVWIDLFHATEEEVNDVASTSPYAEIPSSLRTPDFLDIQRELNHLILENFDVNDPLSILLCAKDPTSKDSVVETLKAATIALFMLTPCEQVICGGRTFLSWGDARPESSPCVTQNDIPLHGSYQGQPITLYPRGIFNDICFGVAGVALRRQIYEWEKKREKPLDRLEPGLECEFSRIAEHLLERYPQLPALLIERENPPVPEICLPEEVQKAPTFASLLKRMYQFLTRKFQEDRWIISLKPVYDNNNPIHRFSFIFFTLLTLVRQAKVVHDKDVTQITLSRNVLFRLKSLSLAHFKVSPEDNPGITNLTSFASDYPLHTLSPITPADISPEAFESFIKEVQALNEREFSGLCDSCKAFMSYQLADDTPYEAYFHAWSRLWPRGVKFEIAERVMTSLAKNYYGHVDILIQSLSPNKRYLLDSRGVEMFTKEVPPFLRPLGSFASALCTFFLPHDPQRHDGNCAVNSFLLGLYGPRAYGILGRNLSQDIQEFREGIVDYATKHFDELKAEFGEEAITQLICNYSRNSGFDSWTTNEVWAIAARKYGRIINIYSTDNSGGYFRTNDKGEIVPYHEDLEIFRPKEPSSGAPINLLLSGPHYYFLQRK